MLVSDAGVRGITILNRAKAVQFEAGRQPKVRAESGVVFSNLANRCASKGLSGLEWAATIPGTVGGAVYGNAGAFGGDVAHDLICTELLTEQGRESWTVGKLAYGYRTSIFNTTHRNRYIIVGVTFRLHQDGPPALKYADLQRWFSDSRERGRDHQACLHGARRHG